MTNSDVRRTLGVEHAVAKTVNLYEAKSRLSKLVEEASAGEEIIIAKAGKPRARLVALASKPRPRRRPGALKGKIWISPDFDDPLPPELLAAFYDGDPSDPDK